MDTLIGADAAKLAGLQVDLLQKIRSGRVTIEHLEWFNRLTKEERNRLCGIAEESIIIPIDRISPFDPVKLLGEGWTIDEEDARSLALARIDLAKVQFLHMLKKGESWVEGEEKFKRLKKAGHVRLDAKVFWTLWENQSLIPEAWKQKTSGNTTYIFFDGTILRSPFGDRCVLFLYWGGGQWHWHSRRFARGWRADAPSAVLASI